MYNVKNDFRKIDSMVSYDKLTMKGKIIIALFVIVVISITFFVLHIFA
jgi:hypothetical protein